VASRQPLRCRLRARAPGFVESCGHTTRS
jgi:hypothetical protein